MLAELCKECGGLINTETDNYCKINYDGSKALDRIGYLHIMCYIALIPKGYFDKPQPQLEYAKKVRMPKRS